MRIIAEDSTIYKPDGNACQTLRLDQTYPAQTLMESSDKRSAINYILDIQPQITKFLMTAFELPLSKADGPGLLLEVLPDHYNTSGQGGATVQLASNSPVPQADADNTATTTMVTNSSIVATETETDNPAATIEKMLQAERNNDYQSLYESISYLDGLTRPPHQAIRKKLIA